MPYLLLAVFWIAWCVLHSALITLTVTEWFRIKFPKSARYYRILYNLFAVITLIPVLFYTDSIKGAPLVTWQGPWRMVPILMGVVALVFFAAGGLRYDFLQFLGLRQMKNQSACSVLTEDCSLDTGGVLSLVRHPWYSAVILVVWARPLDVTAILTNLVVCGYIVAGTFLEERKLKVHFGSQYAAYQQRVSMFFPIKWVRRRFLRKKRPAMHP